MNETFKTIGHALGIDVYSAFVSQRKKDKYLPLEFYRNYYCYGYINDNTQLERRFQIMKSFNLIKTWDQHGCRYFCITEKGIELFKQRFKKEITDKYIPSSKSKERYLEYLHCDGYDSFADFLGIYIPEREYNCLSGHVRLVSKERGIKTSFHKYLKDAKKEYSELRKKNKLNFSNNYNFAY
jgi:hypothetical protein